MNNTLQLIIGIIALMGTIGGFLYWHFKEIKNIEKQVTDLKFQMKELEKKDDLQQQTIDQFKELFPLIKSAVEQITNKKK